MQVIELGKGTYMVHAGTFENQPAVFIEPVNEVHKIGSKAPTQQTLEPNTTVIKINDHKSALVLMEQIARAFL